MQQDQPLLPTGALPRLYEDRTVLVVWAPGGDTRPYEAPARGGGQGYFVRRGSETVEATGHLRLQLLEQTARVPFDDRRSLFADAGRISEKLVKEFLADVGSAIGRDVAFDRRRVYSDMRLVYPLNDHLAARNCALLFFTEEPDRIFPGAKIEIVQFTDDAGGDLIEERTIRGPIHHQVRHTLVYLESLVNVLLEKIPGRAEVDRTVVYPHEAIREAVVNAVYHRSYESVEPTKIYVYPDRMEVTSYPGPVQGIELRHLVGGDRSPRSPARNRRIGESLKELRLAEARGTGLPRMRRWMSENGSPEPTFDFDDHRTYFRVTLPAHPRHRAIHALREAALKVGHRRQAPRPGRTATGRAGPSRLRRSRGPGNRVRRLPGRPGTRQDGLRAFEAAPNKTEAPQPYLRYAEAMLNAGDEAEAKRALGLAPSPGGRASN